MKTCVKCGLEKDDSDFVIKKNGRLHSYCDECRIMGNKEWRLANKDHVCEYKEKTKEYRTQKDKEYRDNNREKLRLVALKYNILCKEKRKEYYKTHKDRTNEYRRAWVAANRDKYNAYFKEYRQKNINQLMAHSIRTRIRKALKGETKYYTLHDVLGCSLSDLRVWLESKFTDGMSWDNYGQAEDKWNIDHIVPLAYFDLSIPEQQKEAFHYTNLQPLWTNLNISKGSEYNGVRHRYKK